MQQIGVVEEACGGYVSVRIQRASACGENCAMCGGCTPTKTIIRAVAEIPCKKGDKVMIEMSAKKVMSAAVLVYLLPLLLLIAGYFFGERLFHTEAAGALTGFFAMGVCFAGVAVADRYLKRVYCHRIIRLVNGAEKV